MSETAMHTISKTQLNQHLWRKQGFDRQSGTSVLDSVTRNNGLYATSRTAYLSLLPRVAGFRFDDLSDELYEERRIVRMCAMRSSVFMIVTDMVPTVYQATKDRCLPGRQQFLPLAGITNADYQRISQQVLDVLVGQPMTLREIKKALPDLSANEQAALKYIVAMMRGEALIVRAKVRGTWKSDSLEYALYNEWLPDIDLTSIAPQEAKIVVARRYFESFGPATTDDLRWWSGFSRDDIEQTLDALRDALIPLAVGGLKGWEYLFLADEIDRLSDSPPAREGASLRLLPVWDGYMMAYRERERYVPPDWYEWVFDASGNSAPVVLNPAEGVIGVWDTVEEKDSLTVKVFVFNGAADKQWAAIQDEAVLLGEAMGLNSVQVIACPAPPPLKEGGQNQFKSPFKDIDGKPIF